MIKVREEREILQMLRDSTVTPEMVEKLLQPPTCRHCGTLLTPVVHRGAIRYNCRSCEDDD